MKRWFWFLLLPLAAWLNGCSSETEQATSGFQPLQSTTHNRLALLQATPGEGEGKLTIFHLDEGRVSEASHRPDFDPTMRVVPESDEVVVLNRVKKGGVLVFDKKTLSLKANYRVLPSNEYPNFQDVMPLGNGEVYLSSYETSDLYRVRLSDGKVLKTISLKEFADDDGVPEAFKMYRHGGEVLLTLQRLKRPSLLPTDYSSVLFIDAEKDVVQKEEKLKCLNPAGPIRKFSDKTVVVACHGSWEKANDGTLEVIDLENQTTRGEIWTSSQLGGRPMDIVSMSPLFLATILYTPEFKLRLSTVFGMAGDKSAEVALLGAGDQTYPTGYRTLAMDLERRLLWVGQDGPKDRFLIAYSLDTREEVRRMRVEFMPVQLEWLE